MLFVPGYDANRDLFFICLFVSAILFTLPGEGSVSENWRRLFFIGIRSSGRRVENKEVKCQDAGWRRLVDTSQLTMGSWIKVAIIDDDG